MIRCRSVLAVAVVALLAAAGLQGHTELLVTLSNGSVAPIRWPQGSSITYRINNQTTTVPNVVAGSNATAAINTAATVIDR